MSNLTEKCNGAIYQLLGDKTLPNKIAVAVSGGSDSLALTVLLKAFCDLHNITLNAVTVDHHMRDNSSEEAQQLHNMLTQYHISHHILSVDQTDIPQSNIEANLRDKRYELLHAFCLQHHIQHLFLGHIQSDIAENFIIRLFRGSGLDGLSAIAPISDYQNITLVRPLLDITKDELQHFLQENNIQWFEDESNKDERFLRNKIRNFFDTFDNKNVIQKRIKNTADEMAQMRDLFDQNMLHEASQILSVEQNSFITLDVTKFTTLETKTALKILALILMEIGQKPYKPRLEKLQRFYDWVIDDNNRKTRNFYGCIAKTFDDARIAIYNEANPGKKIVQFNTILGNIFW